MVHLVAQQFVHGATTVALDRRRLTEDGSAIQIGGTHDPAVGRDAGRFAALSVLHACRAMCAIFGWTEPPEVSELMAEVTDDSMWRSP